MWFVEWWKFMLSGFWPWLGSAIIVLGVFGCIFGGTIKITKTISKGKKDDRLD